MCKKPDTDKMKLRQHGDWHGHTAGADCAAQPHRVQQSDCTGRGDAAGRCRQGRCMAGGLGLILWKWQHQNTAGASPALQQPLGTRREGLNVVSLSLFI